MLATLSVRLGTKFSLVGLEHALHDYYAASLSASHIRFAFDAVQECDWAALPILATWVRSLVARGKRVEFLGPRPDSGRFEASFDAETKADNRLRRVSVREALLRGGFTGTLGREGLELPYGAADSSMLASGLP